MSSYSRPPNIETLIGSYALAFAHGRLRKNQKHIGKIRFHHQIAWQTLMNGILKARPGIIQRLDAPVPMNCK
ncbi:MAG: hypothetical protein HUU50_15565 [Candidatus Brocadiae bacterium]|nr:hypothetical protein [Candidatus Brocadiia bacterium]